jgi:hypothetical protein
MTMPAPAGEALTPAQPVTPARSRPAYVFPRYIYAAVMPTTSSTGSV